MLHKLWCYILCKGTTCSSLQHFDVTFFKIWQRPLWIHWVLTGRLTDEKPLFAWSCQARDRFCFFYDFPPSQRSLSTRSGAENAIGFVRWTLIGFGLVFSSSSLGTDGNHRRICNGPVDSIREGINDEVRGKCSVTECCWNLKVISPGYLFRITTMVYIWGNLNN